MASLNRLKPDQVVYSDEYEVRIIEVNIEDKYVIASRNNNPAQKYYERAVKRWRVSKPKPKPIR